MKSKKCIKCQKRKLTKFFSKRKASKDGLYTYCKLCKRNDDKIYSQKNKKSILKKQKEYYLKNKEKISQQKRKYQEKNIEKRRKYKKIYEKCRKQQDSSYKLIQNYKTRLYKALKGVGTKSQSTTKMLGCSVEDFCSHIEKQFTNGMSWENYGQWHIDHIIPLASAHSIKGKEKLFHYSNCQPLWAKENLRKGDKIFSDA
jgi:hypothetical protein